MNIFISGGCKNGKSMHAQRIAKAMAVSENVPLYYVATMIPTDEEDRQRIRRHIEERAGWGFETLEQGRDICGALRDGVDCRGVFLLDSVTALLSNEMFRPDGTCDFGAGKRVAADQIRREDRQYSLCFRLHILGRKTLRQLYGELPESSGFCGQKSCGNL